MSRSYAAPATVAEWQVYHNRAVHLMIDRVVAVEAKQAELQLALRNLAQHLDAVVSRETMPPAPSEVPLW